ncbi:Crotonobetainyl-CoA reductase [Streptomyces tendae]
MDEEARFPREALEALVANDLHAVHVPEEYGGAGADALATVIVIEEVARVCVSSSLIPAVNKLGSLPVILSGSEDLKKKYMTPLAKGDAMFSYGLSEPDAGSDAAGMKTKAVRDGDFWVLNGVKRWITNAGESEYYTVMAVADPASAPRASPRSSSRSPTRAAPSARRRRSSASRARRRARCTWTTSASRPTA